MTVGNPEDPGRCKWMWTGLGWGQVTYCVAEFACPEPSEDGVQAGDVAFTLCGINDLAG
jgi:hypothetical protein